MRRLTLALLAAAYVCLGLIVAVLIVRTGGGMGAAAAAFLGTLGLALGIQSTWMRGAEKSVLNRQLESVRESQRILVDQVERLDARMASVMQEASSVAEQRTEVLSAEVHQLEDLISDLGDRLEARLQREMRVAPVASGNRARTSPAELLLATVRDAIENNRADLYLQPVMSLPQRRLQFYESFTRLRDDSGRIMMPAEYLRVAEPNGLIAAIDNLLLFRCVRIARRLASQDQRVSIFCNISIESLSDQVFFPQLIEFLKENRDLAGALVFEIGQRAFEGRGAAAARHIDDLNRMGFGFSIDQVSDLDFDFQDMARSGVRYVKIAASRLLDELQEFGGALVLRSLPDLDAADLTRLLKRYGMDLIVEKVETERQIVDLLELDISFGQGNLFGEPRPIRASLLEDMGTVSVPDAPSLRRTRIR